MRPDDDGAANGEPLVPGRALPTTEPLPRGPALLDDVGRFDNHPMPACRPRSVTFARALDGALTVNRHAAMAREAKLVIWFAPERNPVKPNGGRTAQGH